MSTIIYRNSPEGAFLTITGSQASDLNERTQARFFWRVAPMSRDGWHHASPPPPGGNRVCVSSLRSLSSMEKAGVPGPGEKRRRAEGWLEGGVPSALVKSSPWSNLLYPHRHRIAWGLGSAGSDGAHWGRARARGRRRGGRR